MTEELIHPSQTLEFVHVPFSIILFYHIYFDQFVKSPCIVLTLSVFENVATSQFILENKDNEIIRLKEGSDSSPLTGRPHFGASHIQEAT